ncbi:MAG TPA: acetyl-CoA hydrolase/transferase C-terminal domain-containing protein [Spirochaetota bacterium]|nr:acetyl-CoA hydrolase/transferase C-terminal domain-containing protein [Spirochaetota bacterium]HPF05046.1 acetyl-CoA hydrolase/transferase C-terminal domain-containing protein [Spirochaetota bacterium]HPJ41177.1 acetyl-CoA hydrolase/transferase C-terminal domain-containing protein [Spirochaetota bacterium]HPR38168.1 acetyl-CoA hydrolase/transferase C-terminal domain-containing protein [Spirochaetota bacterium]HRX47583.1 acetyl-CoA hydrolase/transferase C-terminal domain-containing protein [S
MNTFLSEYKNKLISAEKAAELVKSNDIIDYGMFATKPVDFDVALSQRVGQLSNVCVRGTGTVPPFPAVIQNDPEQKSFMYFSWYFTLLDRMAGDKNLACHLPFNYHEATLLAYHHRDLIHLKPKIWVAQVTPMDRNGCFNFGLGNSHNRGLALWADITIVEVNENMPRCLGGNDEYIHISEVDYIIEGKNTPVFTTPKMPEASLEEKKIAEFIMPHIEDGSCLQLGIGSLPNAIGEMIAKSDLSDLGIQSEMFCDAMVTMYESGKITNAKKSFDINKSTYSFCLGTKETYDFIHDNPRTASCKVHHTNNPDFVATNDKVVSINNIVEVDLLSQVCSETSGLRQISGTGGQLDFVIGAFHSKGGKSFLAFKSTYKDKQGNLHSRIKPLLKPGSVVTVPRTMVQYLVTENGIYNMKARSVWGRAECLINLAHENFREELIKSAQEMNIWSRTNKVPF